MRRLPEPETSVALIMDRAYEGNETRQLALDLGLPKTVVDAALDVDGEGAAPGDLHWGVSDMPAGVHGRGERCLDVVH
jgi:hypothetical protein